MGLTTQYHGALNGVRLHSALIKGARGQLLLWPWGIVLQQDARGIPLEVIVLSVPERPQTRQKTRRAKADRNRNENHKYIHRRTAFRTTSMEDDDMTVAAISGVASPATATGIAIAL